MNQQTRSSRVAEWAELVGASVPDRLRDDADERFRAGRLTDATDATDVN